MRNVPSQIGLEYEGRLEALLKAYGIPFSTEAQMRRLGFPKTPDACLLEPIAIRLSKCSSSDNGEVNDGGEGEGDHVIVKWIESKAWFGDPEAHATYTSDQYLPYYNRFGPGLVIYWFGHVQVPPNSATFGKIHITDRMPPPEQIIRIRSAYLEDGWAYGQYQYVYG